MPPVEKPSVDAFNTVTIDRIRLVAANLFRTTFLQEAENQDGIRYHVLPDHQAALKILEIVSDSGLILLSTVDDLREVWARLRQLIDAPTNGTPEEEKPGNMDAALWLIQTASTWRALAFSDHESYCTWLKHLANCYGGHVAVTDPDYPYKPDFDLKDSLTAYSAVDDDLLDRLPTAIQQRALLYANPWFAYLTTLQLSYHELFCEVLTVRRKMSTEG